MTGTLPNGKRIRLVQGDITKFAADAIVNAANSALVGGGGVDGAIHRAGGPQIMDELDRIRPSTGGRLDTGKAVATSAGRLPAQFVFHAVGPIWTGGGRSEPKLLEACYRNCLDMAAERDLKSIAFPSISTGVYRFPVAQAARIAIRAVADRLQAPTPVEEATFVLFDENTLRAYESALSALEFPNVTVE